MNPEKASTLRLLKEGMGRTVSLVESRDGEDTHELRADLGPGSESGMIPVIFLLTTLAFLEAQPLDPGEPREPDGWTPADLLSHLRWSRDGLGISLGVIRGRAVFTDVYVTPEGGLTISTQGRGQSAVRWLSFVEGRSHLRPVSVS